MKIKLDENIPSDLCATLRELGHDVDSVPDEGLSGHSDDSVWDAAQREKRLLITQDLDFSDLRKFIFEGHCGVVLVRLRAVSRRRLINRIQAVFESEQVADWAGAFVVVTESKVRVRQTLMADQP